MSLDEIRDLKNRRTPQLTNSILDEQVKKIDENIDYWVRARKLLRILQHMIASVEDADEDTITVKHLPAEAIILGELNDFSRERTFYDAFLSFYQDMIAKHPDLDLNYPVWAIYSEEKIRSGDFSHPDRFYFYNPEGYDKKPAGLYVIGYSRGGYGNTGDLYNRLLKFIDENKYEINGNIYEEYPLNEACVAEQDNYLIRIMISVR